MSKRNMVILGAVAVLIVAGALWAFLGSGSGTPKTSGTPTTKPSTAATLTPSIEESASVEESESVEVTETAAVDGAVSKPIPTDGPHEKAALAAVPAAIKVAQQQKKSVGAEMPDLAGAAPILTSYGIVARIGERIYLFQVFASGKAYEYLRYPMVPDPATQYALQAAGFKQDPLVDPVGAREKAAVAAVQALMKKAYPKEPAKVQVWNYGFMFAGSGGKLVKLSSGVPFRITIDPKGKLTGAE
jgi:hypothetical protein